MSHSMLRLEFNFARMIAIVKNGQSDLAICRKLTDHLVDVIDVAYYKLDLLIKINREIQGFIAGNELVDGKLLHIEGLCERSQELYSEINQLPIMRESPEILLDLLSLRRVGRRYSELLLLIYENPEYISVHENPYGGMSHIHLK